MKNIIKLRITKVAAQTCRDFIDNNHCLAATAARRQFKTKHVFALTKYIRIDGDWFAMSANGADRIGRSYVDYSAWGPRRIRPGFQPFTVTLTKTQESSI